MNVVLIPGLMATIETLRPLRRRLESAGYRCYSSGFLVNRMTEEDTELLAAKIRLLVGIEPPVALVGHSCGGLLALRMAERYPYLVDRVIGLGSFVWGKQVCPVPWYESRSLEGLLFLISGPLEVKNFCVSHALLPEMPWVQDWVVEKLGGQR